MRISIEVPAGPEMAVSTQSTAALTTGSWRTFRPVYVTRPSPCNLDCPAGTDVRAFLTHAAEGRPIDAWRTILEHNPLPGICGRVCYHPCETGCNRTPLDEPVAIHAVERAVAAEAGRASAAAALIASRPPATGKRVAVVGSGPAGLSCAYHLARRGHGPVVFEAADEPGGMLRYGIPAYRLPRETLAEEIDLLRQFGVEFRTRARLGHSLPWSELSGYDAVFVAIGNQKSKAIGVPGDDLRGVRPALDVLRDVNAGELGRVGGRVVVIGGGNTALDAARVALRHNAEVTVLYRRTLRDMPAHPDEIAQAEAEGVRFVFLTAPVKFEGWNGGLIGVVCQRMRPGAPDASGRSTPEPIPGEFFSLPCNQAFTAIGEELERDAVSSVLEIARGRIAADRRGRTSAAPLFAGGDAATGAGTVVDAIGSGRRAAEAMDEWLRTGTVSEPSAETGAVRVLAGDINFFYFGAERRAVSRGLSRADATAGFSEVIGGLAWAEARSEATRCLSCGSCTSCNNCVTFCPDAAVRRTGTGYAVDYAHCKGCGICVTECPRGAMAFVPEETR